MTSQTELEIWKYKLEYLKKSRAIMPMTDPGLFGIETEIKQCEEEIKKLETASKNTTTPPTVRIGRQERIDKLVVWIDDKIEKDCRSTILRLNLSGYLIFPTMSPVELRTFLDRRMPDAILLDYKFTNSPMGHTGSDILIDLLRDNKRFSTKCKVAFVTSYPTIIAKERMPEEFRHIAVFTKTGQMSEGENSEQSLLAFVDKLIFDNG
jgi:hypothetical protein